MTCRACNERGKTWEGSDPKCAFPNGGTFYPGNWNCATANLLRQHFPRWDEPTDPRIAVQRLDDQTVGLVDVSEMNLSDDEWLLSLWVTWYKDRGRTEDMWLLGGGAPKPPTEQDVLAVVAALDAQGMETGTAETPQEVPGEA